MTPDTPEDPESQPPMAGDDDLRAGQFGPGTEQAGVDPDPAPAGDEPPPESPPRS